MTDTDRNTRTLIISFVSAIMVLIPLRFIEAGRQWPATEATVLGEQAQASGELESPYEELEKESCLGQEEADAKIEEMVSGAGMADLTREELDDLTAEIAKVEAKVCE